MKDITIIVKCNGLKVHTNDLEMGIGILDQIAKHGIMKHSFISNKLLEVATEVIDNITEKIEWLRSLNKSKEESIVSDSKPIEEVTVEKTKKTKCSKWTKNQKRISRN